MTRILIHPYGLVRQADASARYFAGLDLHRDTTQACVCDARRRWPWYRAELCDHKAQDLSRFIAHVREHLGEPHGCYEASSCGYVWYRSLQEMG